MAHLDLYSERAAPPHADAEFSCGERLPMRVSAFIWVVMALASWGVVFGAASLLLA